jgi:hypothetical protein
VGVVVTAALGTQQVTELQAVDADLSMMIHSFLASSLNAAPVLLPSFVKRNRIRPAVGTAFAGCRVRNIKRESLVL